MPARCSTSKLQHFWVFSTWIRAFLFCFISFIAFFSASLRWLCDIFNTSLLQFVYKRRHKPYYNNPRLRTQHRWTRYSKYAWMNSYWARRICATVAFLCSHNLLRLQQIQDTQFGPIKREPMGSWWFPNQETIWASKSRPTSTHFYPQYEVKPNDHKSRFHSETTATQTPHSSLGRTACLAFVAISTNWANVQMRQSQN